MRLVQALALYAAPAVTPAQSLNIDREQDRYAATDLFGRHRGSEEGGRADTSVLGGPAAQCVP